MNSTPILEIVNPGPCATIQDAGRWGWQRFGVPPSGAMDEHAFRCANRLLGNPPDAPAVEIFAGAFQVCSRRDCRIALAGAVADWTTIGLRDGELFNLPVGRAGLWCYLAVEGGFDAPTFFGSASAYPRGGLGRRLRPSDILRAKPGAAPEVLPMAEQRPDYAAPFVARVVPGPQDEMFSESDTLRFFNSEYRVSPQIDRVGYRLEGPAIRASAHDIVSEGIAYGAVQIPENGQPIVMMKDRPTVGGYPKIGTLLPEDAARLAQCRPGQIVHFQPR